MHALLDDSPIDRLLFNTREHALTQHDLDHLAHDYAEKRIARQNADKNLATAKAQAVLTGPPLEWARKDFEHSLKYNGPDAVETVRLGGILGAAAAAAALATEAAENAQAEATAAETAETTAFKELTDGHKAVVVASAANATAVRR